MAFNILLTLVFLMPSMDPSGLFSSMTLSIADVIQGGKWILIALPLDRRYYRLASKGDSKMGSWTM